MPATARRSSQREMALSSGVHPRVTIRQARNVKPCARGRHERRAAGARRRQADARAKTASNCASALVLRKAMKKVPMPVMAQFMPQGHGRFVRGKTLDQVDQETA